MIDLFLTQLRQCLSLRKEVKGDETKRKSRLHFRCLLRLTRQSLHPNAPLIRNYTLRVSIFNILDNIIPTLSSPFSPTQAQFLLKALFDRVGSFFFCHLLEPLVSALISCTKSCVIFDSLHGYLRRKALAFLLHLSHDYDKKASFGTNDVIGCIVSFLSSDHSYCCAIVANLLTNLAIVEVNRATIDAFSQATEALVLLFRKR